MLFNSGLTHLRCQLMQRRVILTKHDSYAPLLRNNKFYKKFHNNNNSDGVLKTFREKCNEKLIVLCQLLTAQCNFYVSLRLRRMTQIFGLYNRIYSETSVKRMVTNWMLLMKNRMIMIKQRRIKSKSLKYLLSAASGVFCWEKERISDNDMQMSIEEFVRLTNVSQRFVKPHQNNGSSHLSVSASTDNKSNHNDIGNEWEPIVVRDHFQVWRKYVKHTNLYQYKVYGTFHDIPARTFFYVQMDTEYRKIWDKLVIKLNVIDHENEHTDKNCEDSGNEVLHWVMRYPYPMYSREYVYMRRSKIDYINNIMVLISKSISHPKVPETNDYVRVTNYASQMVIKPHKTFDDCGFDYMLMYYDDPKSAFPSVAYNWMASCGVPDFVDKLHNAAVELHYSNANANTKYKQQSSYCTPIQSNNSNCVYA